jgi:hypothetical protein
MGAINHWPLKCRLSDGSENFYVVALYSLFIVEMSVILMNLVIGLAISNIQVTFVCLFIYTCGMLSHAFVFLLRLQPLCFNPFLFANLLSCDMAVAFFLLKVARAGERTRDFFYFVYFLIPTLYC